MVGVSLFARNLRILIRTRPYIRGMVSPAKRGKQYLAKRGLSYQRSEVGALEGTEKKMCIFAQLSAKFLLTYSENHCEDYSDLLNSYIS